MNESLGVTRRKTTLLQKLALFIICLYACTLYIGYVNDLLLSLQGLCLYAMVGVLLLIVLQRGTLKLNSYLIWYMGFILLAVLSCIYASDRSRAFSSIYTLAVVWVFAFALTMTVERVKHIELFLAALIIGSAILTVYLAATGLFEEYEDTGSRFGEELTGNANVFAAVYMIASSASVYFISKLKNIWGKLAVIAAFVLQLYSLTVSGGRKYFIFPFVLLYIMALQKRDKKKRTHIIRVTIIAAVLLVLAYSLLMNVEFLYENIGYRFEDLWEYTTGQSSEVEGGTVIRERMIERGLELWRESPLIGHGANMFAAIGGFGVYSHNNFVEMLCNHGVFGFIWYYSFYIYVIVKLLKNKSNDSMRHFLIGFAVGLFVYEYGAISYNTLITQVFLVFAVLYDKISERERVSAEAESVSAQ